MALERYPQNTERLKTVEYDCKQLSSIVSNCSSVPIISQAGKMNRDKFKKDTIFINKLQL